MDCATEQIITTNKNVFSPKPNSTDEELEEQWQKFMEE